MVLVDTSVWINLEEYLYVVEQNHLNQRETGFVDIHLLAAARLAGVPLWTHDKKLHQAATELDMAYNT